MVSMVRDLYVGTAMARIMSISMSIFILVPIIAPAVGQAILWVASWRYIFGTFFLTGFVALFWLLIRQPETLPESARRPLKIVTLAGGFMLVCRSRVAVGYTLAMGAMFGAFVGFLSSVQQIFQDTFQVGKWFPYLFAIMALFIGAASFLNSRIKSNSKSLFFGPDISRSSPRISLIKTGKILFNIFIFFELMLSFLS